ncbi:MAG: hypothetical protein ACXWNC_00715 [Anaerolineales bacterium]
MQKDIVQVSGIVVEGHRVASGPSKVYPYGTLVRQKPYFNARGLDLDRFFTGTLNISIAPLRFEMVKPAYTFYQVVWTDLHPPEDFSFSPCTVLFQKRSYDGFVYYPHPETKIRHFQDPSVIEVITAKIPMVNYGSALDLVLDAGAIRIYLP